MSKNMKRMIIPVLLLASVTLPGEAITTSIHTGDIKGTVLDAATGQPLIGANVSVEGTYLGAATSNDGSFRIQDVPAGTYSLLCTYIGYAAATQAIRVDNSRTSHLSIGLRSSLMESSTVVVTGTASPYLYSQSPVKTEVIPRQLMQQAQACNLAEALSLQSGVRVENNCQNCNFTQVRILGMEGKYTQLLIDSAPVVSSLAGVYALEHFPDEMIEQIEVVKGGGSALYGGGAVAGTINMRTRQPYLNRSRVNVQSQTIGDATDHQFSAVTELVAENGKSGTFLYGVARNRSAYDHNGDGYSELGELHHESFGLTWNLRVDPQRDLNLSFHRVNEKRRGGNDFDRPAHEADIAEALTHERTGAKINWSRIINDNLNYNFHYAVSLLDRDSYYGGLGGDTAADSIEALNFYGHAANSTHIAGLRFNWEKGNHLITSGSEFSKDLLTDNSVSNPLYHIDEDHRNLAAYIQDSYRMFDDQLTLVGGARVDKHSSLADPVVSPRFNLKYDWGDHLHLRAAVSTGFKPPQTFDEDLHIESLGGDQRVVRNSASLLPERSLSWSSNVEYEDLRENGAFMLGFSLFHTRLNDAFSEVKLDGIADGLILWERVNSSGAAVSGAEFDCGWMPNSRTEVRLGATLKQGRYEEVQEIFEGVFTDKFLRTPDFFGNLRLSWDATDVLNLNSIARYTGGMLVPNEATLELVEADHAFIELDLGASYQIGLFNDMNSSIVLGFKNIFNAYQEDLQVGAQRDPAYVYGPQLPRRFIGEVNLSF